MANIWTRKSAAELSVEYLFGTGVGGSMAATRNLYCYPAVRGLAIALSPVA